MELCFGQRIDAELGILEPWYTNPATDRIKQIIKENDFNVVMEWGGGASTIWWRHKAKLVYTVDHDENWVHWIYHELGKHNLLGYGEIKGHIQYVNTHEGDQSEKRDAYVKAYPELRPDICIVDGVHRYECAEYAVKHFKPKLLIVDNHRQDYVFMCPALDELLKDVEMERYIQPDHTDHSGNPWATALFFLK